MPSVAAFAWRPNVAYAFALPVRSPCRSVLLLLAECQCVYCASLHARLIPLPLLLLLLLLLLPQNFALFLLARPLDCSLWYCAACLEGGEVVCCDACPAAYHTKCLLSQQQPSHNSQWLCEDCRRVSGGWGLVGHAGLLALGLWDLKSCSDDMRHSACLQSIAVKRLWCICKLSARVGPPNVTSKSGGLQGLRSA
jgi:hypothetical protein